MTARYTRGSRRVRARAPAIVFNGPRLILLDALNPAGERRAAVLLPGRAPIPFVSLVAASAALRSMAAGQ